MAYALVKAGTVATGTTSVSPTFGQTTTANNLLLAFVANVTGGTGINAPSGWSAATGGQTGNTEDAVIFYRVAAGGDTAPTFSDSSSSFMEALLGEFSGNAISSPLDQVGFTTGATSPQTATNGAVDAAVGELVAICQCDTLSKSGTVTTSQTPNNGVVINGLSNNDATSTANHYRFSWGTTTGSSSADNCQAADNSMNLLSINISIASFKLAASGAAFIASDALIVGQSVKRSSIW